jgi:hypothetical protein
MNGGTVLEQGLTVGITVGFTAGQAMGWMQLLLAFAIAQQSLEHLARGDRMIFAPRLLLCLVMGLGIGGAWPVWGLWVISLAMLWRYQGPYNGGSDKMTMLILSCLSLAHLAPTLFWQEMALSYLAVQLVLSYFVSGWIKVINPEWQRGEALRDVFRFSAYPVSEALRGWAGSAPVVCDGLGCDAVRAAVSAVAAAPGRVETGAALCCRISFLQRLLFWPQ